MVHVERGLPRTATASAFARTGKGLAASAGRRSNRPSGWDCAQAGRLASGRVFARFEAILERACSTELKCRAEPPARSWQHVLLTQAQAFRIFVRRRLLGVTRLLQILFQHPQRRAPDVEEASTMCFCPRL